MTRIILHAVVALWLLNWSAASEAHKQSDSYLSITQPAGGPVLNVQWDIALRDLEHAIGLDVNADTAITWGELRQRRPAVVGYARARLQVTTAGVDQPRDCPLRLTQLLVDEHVDGQYAVLRFSAACPQRPAQIDVRYALLFDVDPKHRGLLEVRSAGHSRAAVFAPDSGMQRIRFDTPQPGSQLASFVSEGIWHIWQGYDHVLFLLTLLLPAVVLHRSGQWQPRESLRECVLDIVKVVSAFTLAHSLTLTLGALGWVYVPSRMVESAIAVTVLLGALNILLPLVQRRRWLVAFIFGLIHGLAFASLLVDLGLSGWNLMLALVGFNGGVEIGQLAIVIAVTPFMYASRRTAAYRCVLLPAGAVIVTCFAAYWFVSRAFLPTFANGSV